MKIRTLIWVILFAGVGCSTGEPNATNYKRKMSTQGSISTSDSKAGTKLVLAWLEPIDSTDFGFKPNPNVDGKTLAEILSSTEFGRDDKVMCSACHNSETALGGYGVDAEANEPSLDMAPTDVISGRTWVGEDGWAARFMVNKTKPQNIQVFLGAWKRGGFAITPPSQ